MARYRATVETELPLEEAFDYLSDFSTTQEWDPGVVRAARVDEGPVGNGSEFNLVASFMGRDNELTYGVVEYAPPTGVTFRGENATVVSLDRITLDRRGGGTTITYDADLRLKGVLRVLDPVLGLAFRRVGDRALAGLSRTLREKEQTRATSGVASTLDAENGIGLSAASGCTSRDLRSQ